MLQCRHASRKTSEPKGSERASEKEREKGGSLQKEKKRQRPLSNPLLCFLFLRVRSTRRRGFSSSPLCAEHKRPQTRCLRVCAHVYIDTYTDGQRGVPPSIDVFKYPAMGPRRGYR